MAKLLLESPLPLPERIYIYNCSVPSKIDFIFKEVHVESVNLSMYKGYLGIIFVPRNKVFVEFTSPRTVT